jgi:hypothetical protein
VHESRSQRPRGLRRRFAATWFWGSRVRIPLGAWVCLLCLYAVLSCDGLITRPEESYRASKYMCDHRNPESGPVFQMGTTGKLMNELEKSISGLLHCSPRPATAIRYSPDRGDVNTQLSNFNDSILQISKTSDDDYLVFLPPVSSAVNLCFLSRNVTINS